MHNDITIVQADADKKAAIVELLATEGLPVADLPEDISHFLVALSGDSLVGAVGLEQHGQYGLLRSLVVHREYRDQKIAHHLVNRLEEVVKARGLDSLYLLTETAPAYFAAKGFETISREQVPADLHRSSEFSHVCPQSAIVMKKRIHGGRT